MLVSSPASSMTRERPARTFVPRSLASEGPAAVSGQPVLNLASRLDLCAPIVAPRLRQVAAVAHRAPSAVLRAALIDKKPSTAPLILALLDLLRMRSRQQPRSGPGNRLEQCLRYQPSRGPLPSQGFMRQGDTKACRSGQMHVENSGCSRIRFASVYPRDEQLIDRFAKLNCAPEKRTALARRGFPSGFDLRDDRPLRQPCTANHFSIASGEAARSSTPSRSRQATVLTNLMQSSSRANASGELECDATMGSREHLTC